MDINSLYYGDNLTVMRDKIEDESIDLIYLDPPFNSKRSYNLVYKNVKGHPVQESIEVFRDTWEMDAQKQKLLDDMPHVMSNRRD